MQVVPRRAFLLPILAITLAAAPLTLASGQSDPIGERQAVMKRMDEQAELAVAMAKGRTAFDAESAAGIFKALREGGSGFTALFPAGSESGKTKATSAVWTDRPGFEAANAAFLKALTDADVSTPKTFGAAFTGVMRECRACHQGFKSR